MQKSKKTSASPIFRQVSLSVRIVASTAVAGIGSCCRREMKMGTGQFRCTLAKMRSSPGATFQQDLSTIGIPMPDLELVVGPNEVRHRSRLWNLNWFTGVTTV